MDCFLHHSCLRVSLGNERGPIHLKGGILMSHKGMDDVIFWSDEGDAESVGGSNFLVSAIHLLRRQKRDLLDENENLRLQLQVLQRQNAVFLDLSADRHLQRRG